MSLRDPERRSEDASTRSPSASGLSLRGPHAVVTVDGLDYEQANALVNAFNNGAISFDGRVW